MATSLRRLVVSQVRKYRLGLALARKGPLHDAGWFESAISGQSVDLHGAPIPWMTYAALHLLERKLPRDRSLRVGEFGAGNSTLWWAKRAAKVTAVEHDVTWAETLAARVPSHVRVIYQPAKPTAAYARALKDSGPFDVVVIDGRNRVECAHVAPGMLGETGIIIWDDSERTQYAPGLTLLADQGFRALSLAGLGPVAWDAKETTVFYRDGNMLGL